MNKYKMSREEVLIMLMDEDGHDMEGLLTRMGLEHSKFFKEDPIKGRGKFLVQSKIADVLDDKEFKDAIFPTVLYLDTNKAFLSVYTGLAIIPQYAYEKLYILMGEEEKEINKLFKMSSEIMSNKDDAIDYYRDMIASLLAEIVTQSKSQKNVIKMFEDFREMGKTDETDLFPIIKAFTDKGIDADKVYESIKDLNNAYLETRFVDYLKESKTPFGFNTEKLKMFETEEKIIFERKIRLNTNYFMSLGLHQSIVTDRLEKLTRTICSGDTNARYLFNNNDNDKEFTIEIQSECEDTAIKLQQKIIFNSDLIEKFIMDLECKDEEAREIYFKSFKTFWDIKTQLQDKPKPESIKKPRTSKI